MFKEALAKLTGNRKPVYSTPLVNYVDKQENFKEGRHYSLINNYATKIISRLEKQLNQ